MIQPLLFKKGIATSLATCMLASMSLFAQQLDHPVICGNEIFHAILEKNHPSLLEHFNTTFEDAKRIARGNRNEPLTVNVVVHVIWKNQEENLDDAIIQSQIDVLNNDFNKLNADTSNLRPLFKPVAGNANIHFNLYSVVRVQTNTLFSVDLFGTDLLTNVKHNADGGSDGWDPNTFINIWVCKIQPITIFGQEIGQVFGFSFPPNDLVNWPADSGAPSADEDGLVIDFRVFGVNNPNPVVIPGTSDFLVVQGRTPVHEMGHYFGLRHIWGDGGLLGPNDCAQSDGIDDTPFADSQSNFDCDITKNSCTQSELFYNADVPDLIENYMDYSSEACMDMFSIGQVELMRNILMGPRFGLLMDPSAVTELNKNNALSIFPNPASDHLTVTLQDVHDAVTAIQLVDMNGKIVLLKNENIYSENNQINIATKHVPSGMYLVQVRSQHGIYNGRVVVSKN